MHTPVGLLIFNRPDHTRRVFAEIAKAKPRRLLIIADGPRATVPGEAEKCAAARAVVERVDWDCKVERNYSEENLGCKKRVASGLTWLFDVVEDAIVLEDDTLPHPTFFRFCEEALAKYRDNELVMHVSGGNYQFGRRYGEGSYYFSRYPHIWGWASWRRAWRSYDADMKSWRNVRDTSWLSDALDDPEAAQWWRGHLERVYTNGIDTWDAQWAFAIWRKNGLCVTPNANLVSNIGFGRESTHTRDAHPLSKLDRTAMAFPLRHPARIAYDNAADRFAFEVACKARIPGAAGRASTPPPSYSSRAGLDSGPNRNKAREGLRLAAAAARITKNTACNFLHRSDYKRWSSAENLESWWSTRTDKIAAFIPPGARVLEFGAGRGHLEKRLDKSCIYFASDLVSRGPGTIVCDLNKRPLPDLTELAADVAVFSGVLEYIRDLDSLSAWLARQVSSCVVSYECVAPARGILAAVRRRLRRLYYGYMNHYTEEDFVALFHRGGLMLAECATWENQRIFRFVRPAAPASRAAVG